MYIIRPITLQDQTAFETFAFSASEGILSMPKNKAILQTKIENSIKAFQQNPTEPGHETYLFVLEDLETGDLGGSCGIKARIGKPPHYLYCIEDAPHINHSSDILRRMQILRPHIIKKGPAEICSLYLLSELRGTKSLGLLLTLSRFLFMADFLERFETESTALLRAHFDEDCICVFWEKLGRKFFDMSFSDLQHFIRIAPEFIPAILPKYPVYISLLPEELQQSIGMTHPHTKPALKMLEREGFSFTGEVDAFDGGPKYSCPTKQIRSIAESKLAHIQELSDEEPTGPLMLISNRSLDFRACLSTLKACPSGVVIAREAAEGLRLQIGDSIRYVPPRPG